MGSGCSVRRGARQVRRGVGADVPAGRPRAAGVDDGGMCLLERADREGLLRRVRSRRRARSELSLVRSVVELLTQGDDLWRLLTHQCRLNLEAGL